MTLGYFCGNLKQWQMANSEMSDCVPSVSRILLEKYHKEETNLFNLDIFGCDLCH